MKMKIYLIVLLIISIDAFGQERSFSPGGVSPEIETTKTTETNSNLPTAPVPPKSIESKQIEAALKSEPSWHFGFGLGYSTNTKQTFDSVKLTDNSGTSTGTINYEWENSPELTLSLIKSEPHGWGRAINLTYVTQQKLKGASGTINGVSLTAVITDPAKNESYILDGTFFYRWDSFYLPFGLNYSSHKYTLPSSAIGYSLDVRGGLGAQVGIGFFIDNKFSMEVKSRSLNYNLSSSKPSANNYTGNFGSSYLTSIYVTLKFITGD